MKKRAKKIVKQGQEESSSFSLADAGMFFLAAISLFTLIALLLSNAKRREKLNDHVAVLEKVMYGAR